MALPTNLKAALDTLYDRIMSANDSEMFYEKILIASKLFKVRVKKEHLDDKLRINIEIIEK